MTEKRVQARKHVFLLLLFSGLFLLAALCLVIMIPYQNTNNYLFAFLDKIDLVKAPSHSPRLIFLGGSNLAFGIDSHELESVYKDRVINMALHADLGLKFILDSAKPFLRDGDVVVLSFEYSHFIEKYMYGSDYLLFLLGEVYPEGFKFLNIRQCLSLMTKAPRYLYSTAMKKLFYIIFNKASSEELNSCYDRRAFNKQGDVVYHWSDKLQNHTFESYGGYNEAINQDTFSYIDNFKSEVNNKGVRVIYLFPAIQKSTYQNQHKNIKEIESLLKARAISADIANTPEESALPDNYFYNTAYHLNYKGVQVRTKQGINWLCTVLSDDISPTNCKQQSQILEE